MYNNLTIDDDDGNQFTMNSVDDDDEDEYGDGDDGDGAVCSAVRGVLAFGNGNGLWWPTAFNQCVSVRQLASYVYIALHLSSDLIFFKMQL